MPDTQRNQTALLALAPDNSNGDVTPQDLRDIIVSHANVTQSNTFAASQTVTGTLAATTLTGAGSGITALTAANITPAGTLPALNGSALTSLTAANITASGTLPALNGAALTALNGTNVASGTVADARLSANIPLKNAATTLFNGTGATTLGVKSTGNTSATLSCLNANSEGVTAFVTRFGDVSITLDPSGTDDIVQAPSATLSVVGSNGNVTLQTGADLLIQNATSYQLEEGGAAYRQLKFRSGDITNAGNVYIEAYAGEGEAGDGGHIYIAGETISSGSITASGLDINGTIAATSIEVEDNVTAGSVYVGEDAIIGMTPEMTTTQDLLVNGQLRIANYTEESFAPSYTGYIAVYSASGDYVGRIGIST